MKTIRLSFVFLLCIILQGLPRLSQAQELVNLKHIIQRGETIESLAEMYDVSTGMLKRLNEDMDTFYTGMEVLIPVDKKYLWLRSEEESEAILKDLACYLAGFREATRIYDVGDYKRASKAYYSNIHRYGKYFSCEESYFAMAMCDYNRKRWSSAIDQFSHVISIDGCSDELCDYSKRLRDEAIKQREARQERTANFFSGLLQAAAEVGTAYMAASQSGSSTYDMPAMPQGKSLGSMSDAEFSTYINNSLSQLANISVMQVQQQWAQEEAQFKSSYIASYRSMHGCDPSAEEIQSAYNDHMRTKANAYNTVQRVSSGLYDKELGIGSTSSSTHSTATNPHGGYKCKKISATDKAHCNDTGICQVCNGNKVTRDMIGNIIPCDVCYRTGKCPSCHGN